MDIGVMLPTDAHNSAVFYSERDRLAIKSWYWSGPMYAMTVRDTQVVEQPDPCLQPSQCVLRLRLLRPLELSARKTELAPTARSPLGSTVVARGSG